MPHTLRILGGGMMVGGLMYHGNAGAAIGALFLTISFVIANKENE